MSYLEPYIYSGVPSFLLSIMTITLNVFVIKFYWRSELSLVPLLYTIIASLDILTAIGIIHLCLIFLLRSTEIIDDGTGEVNVMILTFFKQISYRCSVFCNLVLAVSRTIMILKPFYQISIKKVKLACILYAVPWIVLYGFNVEQYHSAYTWEISSRGFLLGAGLASRLYRAHKSPILVRIVRIVPDFVALIIPVIIVFITCIIQVISLHRSNQFPTSANQRHVTITVLLMSTLFVICNSVHSGYMATLIISVLAGNHNLRSELGYGDSRFIFITSLSATLLPILNAALNPVIIITRSNGMRRKFSDSIQRVLPWVRVRRE